MSQRPVRGAGPHAGRRFGDPDEPRGHEGVRGQRPTRRVHIGSPGDTQFPLQYQLLTGSRAVDLGNVEPIGGSTGLLGGHGRRRGPSQIPGAEGVTIDPMVDATDPRRSFAQSSGPFPGG